MAKTKKSSVTISPAEVLTMIEKARQLTLGWAAPYQINIYDIEPVTK